MRKNILKKCKIRFRLTLLIFLGFLSVESFTQNVAGQMFTKSQALNDFGSVTVSVPFSTAVLQALLNQSGDKIMFKIKDGSVIILNNNRNCIYPGNIQIPQNEVYKLFSRTIVSTLLSQGGNPVSYIEMRGDIFTISNGDYTIEFSWPCPPYCP